MDLGVSSNFLFIGGLSVSLVLILTYPWLLAVIIVSFLGGFSAILHVDWYSARLRRVFRNVSRRVSLVASSSAELLPNASSRSLPTDPLQEQLFLTETAASLPCKVCQEKNCRRNDEDHKKINSLKGSPAIFKPQLFKLPKVDDFKIDARLDASISRFSTTVFDYYISSHWAPYETRKQLKLALKKLLTLFAERANRRFFTSSDNSLDKFFRDKLLPLLLDYLIKITKHTGGLEGAKFIFPPGKRIRTKLKVRKLCREVLEHVVSEDDQKCKMWMELCVAVLSDGVCWNLIQLGRDKIPEVLSIYLTDFKFPKDTILTENLQEESNTNSRIAEECQKLESQAGHDETDKANTNSNHKLQHKQTKLPFLLDNFLDRKDSLEQPDPIVSRWRPTLKDIIEETDLLYPLIQYLKHVGGQKALAYLQAVLDESPDAKEYCRRVLEVEYLPGFCRSHFFHESMGLSRVEEALEMISETSPRSKHKGHSRSASYGSRSNPAISDLLKIEGGVVDGLPLYYDVDYSSVYANSTTSSSSGYSSGGQPILRGGNEETDSIFRKKPQLEDVIDKFFSGTTTALKPKKSKEKNESVPRVGIDVKSYEDWNHLDVNERVLIDGTKCDMLDLSTEIVTSYIRVNPWLGPALSGWLRRVHPHLKPHFDAQMQHKLCDFLTVDLFIQIVDLITDAFIHGGENYSEIEKVNDSTREKSTGIPSHTQKLENNHTELFSVNIPQKEDLSLKENHAIDFNTFLKSFVEYFINHIASIDTFLASISINQDYIFLFFVDVLDLLVAELFK